MKKGKLPASLILNFLKSCSDSESIREQVNFESARKKASFDISLARRLPTERNLRELQFAEIESAISSLI